MFLSSNFLTSIHVYCMLATKSLSYIVLFCITFFALQFLWGLSWDLNPTIARHCLSLECLSIVLSILFCLPIMQACGYPASFCGIRPWWKRGRDPGRGAQYPPEGTWLRREAVDRSGSTLRPQRRRTARLRRVRQVLRKGQDQVRLGSIEAFVHSSIHPSVHPFIHLSVRPSIHASIPPSIHPSIHSFIRLSTQPAVYPPMHPSVRLSLHPFIHPSVHPSIHSFIRLSTRVHRKIFFLRIN